MADRIQGLEDSVTFTGDLAVKAGFQVYLYTLTVSWSNLTAGDGIVLRNGSDSSAPFVIPIIFSTANGTLHYTWPQGKSFPLGLFIDTNGNGQVQGGLQYK